MPELEVRKRYTLVVKSSGPLETETFQDVEYQGDMTVWYPDARENSIVVARPVFFDYSRRQLISVKHADVISADPLS